MLKNLISGGSRHSHFQLGQTRHGTGPDDPVASVAVLNFLSVDLLLLGGAHE
jgi:hypothetical protein